MTFTQSQIEALTKEILNFEPRWGKSDWCVSLKFTKEQYNYDDIVELFTSHGYKHWRGQSNLFDSYYQVCMLYGPFGLHKNPANGKITVKTPIIPLAPDVLKLHNNYKKL